MHTTRSTSALLWLLLPLAVGAQQLKFKQLGTQDGLPATEVYNLYQDTKGYVWAFTEYGIARHNGTKFQPALTRLPFDESAIYASCTAPGGTRYIANSHNALYRVSKGNVARITGFEQLQQTFSRNNCLIYHLAADGRNRLYVSTFNDTYLLDLRTKSYRRISGNPQEAVATFHDTGNGYTLIKSSGAVPAQPFMRVTDKQGKTRLRIPVPPGSEGRNAYHRNANGHYFLLNTAIVCQTPAGNRFTYHFDGPTLLFRFSPDGHVWVGTAGRNKGLYEFDRNLQQLHHYLPEWTVSGILFDDQSGLWVSTIENGVYYCRDIRQQHFPKGSPLSSTISTLKKVNNILFAGTAGGELYVHTDSDFRQVGPPVNGNITDIAFYHGYYIIATKQRVLLLDTQFREVPIAASSLPFLAGKASYGLAASSTALVSLSASYLDWFRDGQLVSSSRENGMPRSVALRGKETFIIGTPNSIYLFRDRQVVHPSWLRALQGKNISALVTDASGNTWICTKGWGLYVLTPENRVRPVSDLPSTVVNHLDFLDDGTFLLSTNNGLFVNRFRGTRATGRWLQLTNGEALSAQAYDGWIYSATKHGLTVLRDSTLFRKERTHFHLAGIFSGDQQLPAAPLIFSHEQRNLTFAFDFIAYPFSVKKLHYRLSGPTMDEGTTENMRLRFHNLAPGDYTLSVEQAIEGADPEQHPVVLHFSIQPAFWQTTLFILLLCVIAALVIAGTTALFLRRSRRREQRTMEIARLLTEYKLTALKAQINPHFISNALSAIQHLILSGSVGRANQYLAKFSLLIRYVLQYSDKKVARLNDELNILELNIELEQLRFGDAFRYEKSIDPQLDVYAVCIPPLITQPFVENAIWHGLLPLNGLREPVLTIRLTQQGDFLHIAIIDNGVGRSTQKTAHPFPANKESSGNQLITQRIQTINRLYADQPSVIEITDLQDDAGKAIGTQVELIFPLAVLEAMKHDL